MMRSWPWVVGAFGVLLLVILSLLESGSFQLLIHTALLVSAVACLAVPWGAAVAIAICRFRPPGANWALAATLSACVIPLYVQAASWLAVAGPTGWLRRQMGLPIDLSGWTAAIWIHACASLPWVICIVSAGLFGIQPSVEEAALLTRRTSSVLRDVTLPLLRPALMAACVWVGCLVATEMTVTDLFRVRTYAEELYTFTAGTGSLEAGTVGVLPGIAVIALISAGLIWGLVRAIPTERISHDGRRQIFLPQRSAWVPGAIAWATPLIVIFVPLAGLIHVAGLRFTEISQSERTWSVHELMLSITTAPRAFGREFVWTTLVSVAAATTSVAIGGGMAWLAHRRGMVPAMIVVAALGLAIPGPVVGYALIQIFNHPHPISVYLYDRTVLLPVIAVTVKATPLVFLLLYESWRTLSSDLLDAVRLNRSGGWPIVWNVYLPLRWRTLVVAWLVGAIVATGDLAATILVIPPGVSTLATRIFDRLHTGADKQVAGLCLLLFFTAMAVSGFIFWLCRSGFREKEIGSSSSTGETP